jgi:pyridoxal/pyridoxine/pyridoxamine kinase
MAKIHYVQVIAEVPTGYASKAEAERIAAKIVAAIRDSHKNVNTDTTIWEGTR